MNPETVVLASSSPRRHMLFRHMGIPFRVMFQDTDESMQKGESPDAYVVRIACLKAELIHGKINNHIIVGADTVVEVDGTILGKPSTAGEASLMLNLLSGKTHRVLTGVAAIGSPAGVQRTGLEVSHVRFKQLNERMIQQYVETNEPIGKAGAYAIQGHGLLLIEGWRGSYSNIVGLPLRLTQELLLTFGCRITYQDS